MNKKLLGISIGLLAMAAIGSANPVACNVPPPLPPSLLADTVDASNTVGSLVYSCGGLTFSNFFATDAGGTPIGTNVYLNSATLDAATGIVELNFNPNMSLTAEEDMHFSFLVTGGITAVDMTTFGNGASITETACTGEIIPVNTGCTGALAPSITVQTGEAQTSLSFALTNSVTIFKDIHKGANGDLTSFNQSFHTVVPEPMTLSMMGFGLLGLGLLRRRQAGKK